MKKTNRKGIMSCICKSHEHDLIWRLEDYKNLDWPPSISVQVYLGYNFDYPRIFNYIPTNILFDIVLKFYFFYRRCKTALFYVLGHQSNEGAFGVFEISEGNERHAQKIIDLMEEFQDRYRIWECQVKDEEN